MNIVIFVVNMIGLSERFWDIERFGMFNNGLVSMEFPKVMGMAFVKIL